MSERTSFRLQKWARAYLIAIVMCRKALAHNLWRERPMGLRGASVGRILLAEHSMVLTGREQLGLGVEDEVDRLHRHAGGSGDVSHAGVGVAA